MALSIVTNECNMQMMARYPDKFFDLAVVDPPYGINVHKQRIKSNRTTAKWANPKSYDYHVFDDTETPSACYFAELRRVSKNQVIWGGNYFAHILPVTSGWVVWDKKADIKEHMSMCELAWTSFNCKCNKFEFLWAGFKKAVQEQRFHPTQKPIALYTWLLQNYAKPGDKILDTHLGSGSSRIAAYDLGFAFYGCEKDEDYYKAQEARFATHLSKPKLFTPQQLYIEQTGLFTNS